MAGWLDRPRDEETDFKSTQNTIRMYNFYWTLVDHMLVLPREVSVPINQL
jgi:hypothetical protein